MKTYWDYTNKERSEMTDAEVRSLLDVELMTKGVKKPVPPTLREVPKSPLGDKRKLFAVEGKTKYGSSEPSGVVFETLEKAQAFIDLQPMKRDYDYEVGSEFQYFIPLRDAAIVSEEIYSYEQIQSFRSQLKERKAITEENERQQSDYDKARDVSGKITAGVWSDWSGQRAKAMEMKAIGQTYAEYLKMTDGNGKLAMEFLAKIYSPEDIADAREWFPDSLPADINPK